MKIPFLQKHQGPATRVSFGSIVAARFLADLWTVLPLVILAAGIMAWDHNTLPFIATAALQIGAVIWLSLQFIALAFTFHEFGHYAALRIAGQRVCYVVTGSHLGPFCRLGSIGGTDIRLGLGYFGRAEPATPHSQLSPRDLRLGAAGGPAASLILAVALCFLGVRTDHNVIRVALYCVAVGMMSFTVFEAFRLKSLPNSDLALIIRGRWKS